MTEIRSAGTMTEIRSDRGMLPLLPSSTSPAGAPGTGGAVPAIASGRLDTGTMRRSRKTRSVRLDLAVGLPSSLGFLSWACGNPRRGDLVAEALRRAGIGA